MNISTIRKALTAPILAAATVLTQWVNSGKFDQTSVRALGASVVVALVVFFVPNDTPAPAPTTVVPAAPPAPPAPAV